MSKDCDVLVVGGGPAGAAAARVLAAGGVSVFVLDKCRFPRPKLCGGLLTRKTMLAVERLFGHDPDELLRLGVVDSACHGYEVRWRDVRLASGRASYPFHFVDRFVFDHYLLDRARQAGAQVLEGAGVMSCDPDRVEVACRDGRRFRAGYVIGADGVNSVVRRSLSVDARAWRQGLAGAVEIAVPRGGLRFNASGPTVFGGFNRGGYAWVFPNRNRTLVGMAARLSAGEHLAARFRGFLGHLGPSSLPARLRGHALPYGNFLRRPGRGRVLLAGDAAGMADPLLAEGVYYALRTGEAAGLAVLDGLAGARDVAAGYAARLEAQVLPGLVQAGRWYKMFAALNRLGAATGLRGLFRMAGAGIEEMVHGERSLRGLRRQEC